MNIFRIPLEADSFAFLDSVCCLNLDFTALGAECDRIVAFGDSVNDLSLFEAADESYAVANAGGQVRAAASGVILSNEADGVVKKIREMTNNF